MDTSALLPQLVALACVALAVGYVQAVLTPTARARFDAANPEKRARVKELMAGDDGDGRGLERWYYRNVLLRSGLRPRGDQTRGGTIVPGLNDAGADDAKGPGIGGARRSTGGARGGASAGKRGGGEERRDAVADRREAGRTRVIPPSVKSHLCVKIHPTKSARGRRARAAVPATRLLVFKNFVAGPSPLRFASRGALAIARRASSTPVPFARSPAPLVAAHEPPLPSAEVPRRPHAAPIVRARIF